MASLITVDYLKKVPLPIKDVQWDKLDEDFLEEIVESAGDFVEDYLDRKIAQTDYVERIPGKDAYTLILQHYPVTAIESVTELDEIEGAISHDLNAFILHGDAGILEWKNKYFNFFYSKRVYRVTYEAGYEIVPGPLKLATALQAYEMLQPFLRGSRDMQPVDLVPSSSEKFVELTEKYRRKRIG